MQREKEEKKKRIGYGELWLFKTFKAVIRTPFQFIRIINDLDVEEKDDF